MYNRILTFRSCNEGEGKTFCMVFAFNVKMGARYIYVCVCVFAFVSYFVSFILQRTNSSPTGKGKTGRIVCQ